MFYGLNTMRSMYNASPALQQIKLKKFLWYHLALVNPTICACPALAVALNNCWGVFLHHLLSFGG